MRRLWPVLLGLLALTWAAPARSQVHVSPEERFFRIEFQLEGAESGRPAIVGSVRNEYRSAVQGLQLLVQVVDEAGRVTHETLGTVGDIPPGGRGGFRLELPEVGARLVVTVQAFEFASAQAP